MQIRKHKAFSYNSHKNELLIKSPRPLHAALRMFLDYWQRHRDLGLFHVSKVRASADRRTDRRYQTYYLPCFAVDKYRARKLWCVHRKNLWPLLYNTSIQNIFYPCHLFLLHIGLSGGPDAGYSWATAGQGIPPQQGVSRGATSVVTPLQYSSTPGQSHSPTAGTVSTWTDLPYRGYG